MKWNHWIRQTHRWLSIAFTVGVAINIVAVVRDGYANRIGLLAGIPLALLLPTGLYPFALSYVTRWRGAGQPGA